MQHKKDAYFIFPDVASYNELSFEKLTFKNCQQLYLMLKDDENHFTDNRFKHYEDAKEYAQYIEQHGAYSAKHSGQDWLFLWKGEYAGVLHLYDLSLETFAENNHRCWVGFATKPAMRNKGITKKALQRFIQYIFENYPFIKYLHSMTLKENLASQALLRSVGFKEDKEERMAKEYVFYLMEK